MKISIVLPSRNNLKYLKWAYAAIRKNQGDHDVEICIADDASIDGTWSWLQKQIKKDKKLVIYRNDGPERVGHTILYDTLVDLATSPICMIYHADMYLVPGALDAIEKNMYKRNELNSLQPPTSTYEEIPKTIVSLTRIEPPLHPAGPEKVLKDWGIEPEDFDEKEFLEWATGFELDGYVQHRMAIEKAWETKVTEGVFAPWAFWKKDFVEIGGHDPLFAPQSKEDSDIFNRFLLNGVKFVQTWEGFVYHMTCRGSRFNPLLTKPGHNSKEWDEQNLKSSKNFTRKWGSFVKHDPLMKPIVPPKYDVAIFLKGGAAMLEALEPWCSHIYVTDPKVATAYIEKEQPNTTMDLSKRVHSTVDKHPKHDIEVDINEDLFDQQDYNLVRQLAEIIQQNGLVGEFDLGHLKITIRSLTEYQNNLIRV